MKRIDSPCGISSEECIDHYCNKCFPYISIDKEKGFFTIGGIMPDHPKDKPNIDPYYMKQSKHIVDMLFDKGFLAKDCSRDDMDAVEEFLGFMLHSHCEIAARAALLTKKAKEV